MVALFIHSAFALLISVAVLYLYAFACYRYFRFFYQGRDRLIKFLEDKHKVFGFKLSQPEKIVTVELVKKFASGGWGVLGLSSIGIFQYMDQRTPVESSMPLLITCLLLPFFGGLIFADSWFGLYAMNELQIDQYGEKIAETEGRMDL